MRTAKSQAELDLAKDIKINNRRFLKQKSKRRTRKDDVGLLCSEDGVGIESD